MSTEQNKAMARRVVEEVINKGKMDTLGEHFAPNYVEHAAPPGVPPNLEGFKQFFTMFRSAFPDLTYTIDFEVAEGDKVFQRITGRATMKGAFMGMPPTGKQATWTESHIARYANGKVAEHWSNQDQTGMMQQLGLMPAPG